MPKGVGVQVPPWSLMTEEELLLIWEAEEAEIAAPEVAIAHWLCELREAVDHNGC